MLLRGEKYSFNNLQCNQSKNEESTLHLYGRYLKQTFTFLPLDTPLPISVKATTKHDMQIGRRTFFFEVRNMVLQSIITVPHNTSLKAAIFKLRTQI